MFTPFLSEAVSLPARFGLNLCRSKGYFYNETQGYKEDGVSALLASELLGLPFSANQEELLLNHSTHCNCSMNLKRRIHPVCTSVHCW